jgi:hypothetical protein
MRTLILPAALGAALNAFAQTPAVPLVLQHHGRLLLENDAPAEGAVKIKFAIYAHNQANPLDPQTTTPLWSETYDVQASGGRYAVALGSAAEGDPIPAGVFDAPSRFLGITVDPEAAGAKEMEPRLQFGTVAYAMRAERAGRAESAAEADHAAQATRALAADLADDLACAGCVGLADIAVSELHGKIDPRGTFVARDADGNATVTGTLTVGEGQTVAGMVAAAGFAGSGALLTDLPAAEIDGVIGAAHLDLSGVVEPEAIDCPDGQSVWRVNADGSFDCRASAPAQASDLACTSCVAPSELAADLASSFTTHSSGAVAGVRIAAGTSAPVACSSANAGFLWFNTQTKSIVVCDGQNYVGLSACADGSNSQSAGSSCLAIKQQCGVTADGKRWIDPDGAGGSVPFEAYCDMQRDQGGWTLVARAIYNTHTHVNANAVGTLDSPAQPAAAKFSDAVINQIRQANGGYTVSVIRLNNDGSKADYFKQNLAFCATCSSGSGDTINQTYGAHDEALSGSGVCAGAFNPGYHKGITGWNCDENFIYDDAGGFRTSSYESGTMWVR